MNPFIQSKPYVKWDEDEEVQHLICDERHCKPHTRFKKGNAKSNHTLRTTTWPCLLYVEIDQGWNHYIEDHSFLYKAPRGSDRGSNIDHPWRISKFLYNRRSPSTITLDNIDFAPQESVGLYLSLTSWKKLIHMTLVYNYSHFFKHAVYRP